MKYLAIQVLLMFSVQVFAVSLCFAQTNDHKAAFRAADTNNDGIMSLDEFKQHARSEAFKNIDRDGDKKISKREWRAADPSPKADGNFEAADQNRDNTIHEQEFSQAIDRHSDSGEVFNALDRNRDGSLSPDEYNARPAFNIISFKF